MDRNSVIFGIGLGIIMLALVFYMGGSLLSKADGMTDAQIIARAEELGMEFPKAAEPEAQAPATQPPATQQPAAQAPATQPPATQTPATQQPAAQTPEPQTPAAQQPAAQTPEPQTSAFATQNQATMLPVRIPDGATDDEVAGILLDHGVITNTDDFLEYLGGTPNNDINGGVFILPVNGDYDKILDVLLDRL